MSKSKHTPGPWEHLQECDDKNWSIVVDGSGCVVANVNSVTGPDAVSAPAKRPMPSLANARLIAVSPEMFEVCKKIIAASRYATNIGEGLAAFHEAAVSAQRVLDKVEGGAA